MTLELACNSFGDDGPPVVIMHGLFGGARNWTSIAKRLAQANRVFALDLRNHGASPWSDDITYPLMAEDVRAFIEAQQIEPVTLIGHSMGGKVAMRLALEYRDLVDRLVVVDIAPVAYEHSFDEFFDAMRDVDLEAASRRADVEAALADTIADPGVRAFLLQNLTRRDGAFAWQLNLDALAIHMEDLTGWPDDLPGRQFEGPTLFISGERSDYIRPEHRPLITDLFPESGFMTLKNAGHWVHAEQPEAFATTVRVFLDRT